jgi:heptaprenyl diphosphate synthase
MNKDELTEQLQSFLEKHGNEALKKASESILGERFDCKTVQDALHYFMTEYWHDCTTPTLIFLACEAVNGNSNRLTDLASAMILINGAIDIHDDIIDHSTRKDGRPTIYGKFGKEVALLSGDALFFKGSMKLIESCQSFDMERNKSILTFLKQGFFELGEAEVFELSFRHRFDVKPEEYLKITHKKAADVEALMRIGALLGGASTSQIEILGKYGRTVGFLSILRDDMIDMTLWDELRHRIKYECLPLPLLYALNDSEMRVSLDGLLRRKSNTRSDFEKICYLTEKGHGFEKTREYINGQRRKGEALVKKLANRTQELNLIVDGLANFKKER